MAMSFSLCPHLIRSKLRGEKRSVLVTGAAGRIGSHFSERVHQKYHLRLMAQHESDKSKLEGLGEVIVCDLRDLEGLKNACDGIDTVLHLAGNASPSATWDELLPDNVLGTYNLFAAAKFASVRRVIYASSIHVVSGYRPDVQVKADDPVNPGDLYGVTKCFGEALARYMAEKEGLSSICIRIGAFRQREKAKSLPPELLDAWVSPRDLCHLFEKCIDDDRLQFAIFHGLSDNRFKRLDISSARELVTYAPQDDLAKENPELAKTLVDGQISHNLNDGEKSGLRKDLR